jgi:hypothetical protein
MQENPGVSDAVALHSGGAPWATPAFSTQGERSPAPPSGGGAHAG